MDENKHIFRRATVDDLPVIVDMLLDDDLGLERENLTDGLGSYQSAFFEIEPDPNNQIWVAIQRNRVVGVLQLTFIRCLTFQGGRRSQIEGVRTHREFRGIGIGRALIEYAIQLSRDSGCHLIQLTSNQKRTRAIDFYKKLGFSPTHVGFKMEIKNESSYGANLIRS